MKKHVFILIRYSVLTKSRNGWVIGRDKEFEDYKRNLFDPQRLAIHEKIFKEVTIPSLSKMEKSNTTIMVFTSDELPDPFLSNLYDIAKSAGNVKVFSLSREQAITANMHHYLLKELEKNAEDVCYATVRLDDDDALADDYYAKLFRYLSPEFIGHSISFPQGYAGLYDGDKYIKFHPVSLPKLALGLSHVHLYKKGQKANKMLSIYGLGDHNRIDEKAPLVLVPEKGVYIRTVHKESDMYSDKLLKRLSGDKEEASFLEVKENFSFLVDCLPSGGKNISEDGLLLTSHGTYLSYSYSKDKVLHFTREELFANPDLEPFWFDSKNMKAILRSGLASNLRDKVEMTAIIASSLTGKEYYFAGSFDDQRLALIVE
ncbi:putative rhamnosyl transferase [Halomonas sp. BLK-85]